MIKILELLKEAHSVLLFPHVQIDGDAFGSSLALCRVLRNEGKTAYIIMNEPVPQNMSFLCGADCSDYCAAKMELPDTPDLCLAVDCSDLSRLEGREDLFFSAKNTACIDHHVTNEAFAKYYYVDTKAAATAEIVYRMFRKMEAKIDTMAAEALYVGVATDTGNFQYSNTTKKTHQMVAELFDYGIDHNNISVNLFQSVRMEKIRLTAIALSEMKLFAGGKACITYISQKALQESGALFNETEGIIEQLRNIKGVEISVVLKEDAGRIKVGLRAKTIANVAAVAQHFGGGGHEKAAGCTIEGSMEDAGEKITAAVEAELTRVFG